MARPRAYRHDVRCHECGPNCMPQDGTSCIVARRVTRIAWRCWGVLWRSCWWTGPRNPVPVYVENTNQPGPGNPPRPGRLRRPPPLPHPRRPHRLGMLPPNGIPYAARRRPPRRRRLRPNRPPRRPPPGQRGTPGPHPLRHPQRPPGLPTRRRLQQRRNRLAAHHPRHGPPRNRPLHDALYLNRDHIEFAVCLTDTPRWATHLEQRLIKHYQPEYNRLLK